MSIYRNRKSSRVPSQRRKIIPGVELRGFTIWGGAGPPLHIIVPRWSPDGTQIAFTGILPGGPWQIYIVSAEGGEPHVVAPSEHDQLDATWSPDGGSLIFGHGMYYAASPVLSSVDLPSGYVKVIPGSENKYSPRVSPDGRFVVAIDTPITRSLSLFDRKTESWSLLVKENRDVSYPLWSRDSKSVYFLDNADPSALPLYRVRIADRKLARVAVLKAPGGATGSFGVWVGWTTDGSPLVLRDLKIEEIHALDVDFP